MGFSLRGAVHWYRDDQKREARTSNPTEHTNVRFDDLDLLLRSYDFLPAQKESHVTYEHATYDDQRVTVVKPHGGTTQVKAVYVRDALLVIDIVRVRIAEEKQKAAKG